MTFGMTHAGVSVARFGLQITTAQLRPKHASERNMPGIVTLKTATGVLG
jgi:hypothetical protein